MSDAKNPNPDPSMDDILASIRKIISDDEARAQVDDHQQASVPGEAAGMAPPHLMAQGETKPAGRDDVLLLTDLIEEPKSEKMPAAIPLPRIDPVRAAEMPQPSVEQAAPVSDLLVAGGAAASASSAFARLSQVVQESVPPPAASDPGPMVGGGSRTVEDLMKEALRPMLKEWLDRNLQQIVERYVEREIIRLTRR